MMSNAISLGGIVSTTVRPNQVWADNDPRSSGRRIRVDSLDGGYANCSVMQDRTDPAPLHSRPGRGIERPAGHSNVGRPTRIAIERFRPTSSGYRLVTDA